MSHLTGSDEDQKCRPPSDRGPGVSGWRRRPSGTVVRWIVAALIAVGAGAVLSPPIAVAATGPPPGPVIPRAAASPAVCAIEIVGEPGQPVPSSTVPGACVSSSTSGTVPRVALAGELPATGSATALIGVLAAGVVAAGLATSFVARRSRR